MIENVRDNGVSTRTVEPTDLKGILKTGVVAKEVTWCDTNVVDKGDQYVIRSMRIDWVCETGEDKPWKTLVLMNGGASNAVGSSLMARMAIEAAKKAGNLSETNLRIIVLPHIESEPRQTHGKESYENMAIVLKKVLYNPELNPTEDLNLFGFSAGGAQMLALAAELGDRCSNLILMDSAGLSDHNNLEYEFAFGSILSVFKKYFFGEEYKKLDLSKKVDLVSKEIGKAWSSSRSVAGSFFGIVDDVVGQKVTKEALKIGKHYGLGPSDMIPIGLNIKRTKKMIDREVFAKIKARIVYAPIIFSRVVNDVIDGFDDPVMAGEIRLGKMPEKVKERLEEYLKKLFTGSERIDVVLSENSTHSSVMVDEGYWEEVMKRLVE